MITINMRQLRDTRKVKAWLKAGESLELWDRKQYIGKLLPPSKMVPKKQIEWPDFAERRKRILGDRNLNAVENFLKERHRD
ncbi:MAG TPA: hypothetical protein VFA02_13300 [Pseudacidobacterium sp.]|nr:hypothetical protein [Pseudacidobacterium sp.]